MRYDIKEKDKLSQRGIFTIFLQSLSSELMEKTLWKILFSLLLSV